LKTLIIALLLASSLYGLAPESTFKNITAFCEEQWIRGNGGLPKTHEMLDRYIRFDKCRKVIQLDDVERRIYRVSVQKGLLYDYSGKLLHTGKKMAIYVLSPEGDLYVHIYNRNPYIFSHSSFLSGGKIAGAGNIKVIRGHITFLDNTSGHYFNSIHFDSFSYAISKLKDYSNELLIQVAEHLVSMKVKFGYRGEGAHIVSNDQRLHLLISSHEQINFPAPELVNDFNDKRLDFNVHQYVPKPNMYGISIENFSEKGLLEKIVFEDLTMYA